MTAEDITEMIFNLNANEYEFLTRLIVSDNNKLGIVDPTMLCKAEMEFHTRI